MGRAHEVRAASMAKTAAAKSKLYSRYGKEIFIAAKSGVPDPDMNLNLARKIKEAKSQQVPADVIKRAIDKAKGGSDENFEECRYEGFGPADSTVIVDCLTNNTNRTYTDVKTAFNHSKGAKIANSGAVSFGYQRLGYIAFETEATDDEKMLDLLIENEVDVTDIVYDDSYLEIKMNPSDLGKAQDAIEKELGEIEYDSCEVTMIPDEYVTLTEQEDIDNYNKLMTLLNDCDDVDKIYTNVKLPEEE